MKTSESDGHCCYAKGKDKAGTSVSRCISLNKSEYDQIKDYIKTLENQGYEIKKIRL